MKSTGLFGKNSGRVGGVVYSTYRGEQIVRAYQPKVKNPNTKKQIEQRAKFKLVTQVAASLGKELKMSFVPTVQKESPRNSFIKAMLKKTTYSNNQASLPIEDIILTNSSVNGFMQFNVTQQMIMGVLSSGYTSLARVRIVFLGYNDGGEIVPITTMDKQVTEAVSDDGVTLSFTAQPPAIQGYTNIRALAYVYEPQASEGASYEDYEVLEEEATLNDALRIFSGRINYSQTSNVLVPQNV